MDRSAYSDEQDADQPDSYWRRRVIALAAGLGLLGVLAWAFSGGSGKSPNPAPRPSQTTSILPAAAYSGAPASSPTTTSSGLAVKAIPGLPTASASASSRSAASKKPRTSPGGKSGPSAVPAVTSGSDRGPNGACSPSAVVLSLFISKSEYHRGQDPQFGLYAVSTGAQSCAFEMGPAKLDLVVMSAGRVIWESSDCAKGDSSRTAELSRGVPVQESVSWNRSVTLPGCVTLASLARPGTYQVQAKTADVASPVLTFKLGRLPARA